MITIYKPDNEPLMSIEVDDESYHYAEIMGRDDVTLYFSLPHYVEFPIGCYIYYPVETSQNNSSYIYTLYSVDKMRMEHKRDYEYTITFESEAVELGNYILTLLTTAPNFNRDWWRGYDDGDFIFPMAGTSAEHLRLIADCMTHKTGNTWSVGSTVDGGEKLISYDTMTCLDALKQIADAFETEYSIVGRTINLGKVEYYTDVQSQVPISYGKGNGLRPGVEKVIDSSHKAIGKVYVQGGDRNIDPSKYGSSTLHMPLTGYTDPSTHLFVDTYWYYDGHTISETEFEGAKKFRCPTGRYIELVDENAPRAEGALDLSEIYPHFLHTITEVEEEDRDKNWWNIYSSEFTAGSSYSGHINYGECLIKNGEELAIIFQTGDLAGRQFGVEWATKEDPDHEGQTIGYMKIVPSEQDGLDMPSYASGFYPGVGDQFMVFNCYLPNPYILSAQDEMRDQAIAYLWENMSERFSIKGEIDPIWSSSRWLNIGDHFKPGAYFRFTDPTWENDGVSIRIVNVKTFINKPHQPVVELSSSITKQGVVTALQKIQAEARVVPELNSYSSRSFTKRSFADAKETMEMLIQAGLDGFDPPISPITVQTMQLLVGSEPLQFRFITNRTTPTEIDEPYTFNSSTKKLEYTACALQHMTLCITDIRSSSDSRLLTAYKIWDISSGESAVLDDPEMPYYLYVKCDADNDGTNHLNGSFFLSDKNHPMDMGPITETEGGVDHHYYYFLAAIVNAEREGDRSTGRLHGFTEVLPGQITTEIIRGSSGTSWWNLSTNQLQIGSTNSANLSYSPSGGLRIRGAIAVNGGNNTSAIGVWRGQYLPGNSYYEGDEVWYEYPANSGIISTYRCKTYTTSGTYPTNTEYWEILANGVAGVGVSETPEDAFWKETTLDGINPPQTPDPLPSGKTEEDYWKSTRPTGSARRSGEYIWKRTKTIYTDNTIFYSYSAEYLASKGDDGDPGPWLNSRGEWESTAVYVGNSTSCDVVHYTNGTWYRAKPDAGNIPAGTLPTNITYWEAFEASFSNVATGLLFAVSAYVDHLYTRELNTEGTNGRIYAYDNYLHMIDGSGNTKLTISGDNLEPLSNVTGLSQRIDSHNETAYSGVAEYSTTLWSDRDYRDDPLTITEANNSVFLPQMTIQVNRSSGSYETLDIRATYRVDGRPVASVSEEGYPITPNQSPIYFYVPEMYLAMSAGNHIISFEVYAATPSSNSLSSVSYYTTSSGAKMTVTYLTECVQIGANGFRAAFSPTIYLSSLKINNAIEHIMIHGSNGIKLTSSNMLFTFDGGTTWWKADRDQNTGYLKLTT